MTLDDLTKLAAVLSAAAAICSFFTAALALWIARAARRATVEGQLQAWMLSYLKEHAVLNMKCHQALELANYKTLEPGLRNHGEIVAGLLVGTIELMHRSKDDREKVWVEFLENLGGAVASTGPFKLENYAATERGRCQIRSARAKVLAAANQ